jgi:hypothetical protein
MNDKLFDWDDANILHIAEHDLTPEEEAEEVVLGDALEKGFDAGTMGEERWYYVGETAQGRVLQVVIAMRGKRIRVVTGFKPTKRDELTYLEYKAEKQ